LTERNEGCSHLILLFTHGINIVSELPWIAANASNHIVGIMEVATDRNKIHPSRNGTAAHFLGLCVRVDQMILVDKAKVGFIH
jgi:hypothetical protein